MRPKMIKNATTVGSLATYLEIAPKRRLTQGMLVQSVINVVKMDILQENARTSVNLSAITAIRKDI